MGVEDTTQPPPPATTAPTEKDSAPKQQVTEANSTNTPTTTAAAVAVAPSSGEASAEEATASSEVSPSSDRDAAVDAPAVAAGGGGDGDMAVCITVYPPPQSGTAPLMLEPLAGVELVMQVRQLLGEVPQTCLYTAFRLVAVTPVTGEGGSGGNGGKEDVWKGDGEVMNDFVELRSIAAVAARPERVEVRMELDAYTNHTARQHVVKFRELLRYPPPCADGMGPGAKAGNSKKGKGKAGGKNKKSKEAAPAAASTSTSTPTGAPTNEIVAATAVAASSAVAAAGDPAAEDMAQRVQRALDIRGRLKDCRVPVGGEGLGCFYGVGLGLAVEEVAQPSKQEAAAASGKGGGKDKEFPITCLRGVSVSAWNPPPPQRRMIGDLMYLEVTALDGTVIHVTCTQGGFYVNGTRRENFDPKPAANNPCHSHELATCLLTYNPSFAKAWNNAVTQAWKRSQADDPVHALARAMREGRGDAVMVKPQWNMPIPEPKWAAHSADPSRAQEELCNGFGMEDRGVPREWNDEYQCLLELPSDTPDLSMTRSRALHKLLCDFQEAATAGALAISDGHIPAANPTEAEHSHVFVFNNIFFSYAADSPDAYKAVEGEAAARKSASQDLASVVALNNLSEAFHPQLSIKTLATAVVDYAGRRIIAQSLVPGILSGDQTDKVVYGAMEHGQQLRENDKVSTLLRDVGERLMIAERELSSAPIKKRGETAGLSTVRANEKPGDAAGDHASNAAAEALAPAAKAAEIVETPGVSEKKDGGDGGADGDEDRESKTVKITGAVEMKGIVGSDGRSYLLDVSRLTPRDANWVRGDKGTGVYGDWIKAHDEKPIAPAAWEGEGQETRGEGLDLSFEQMAVLRPALLTMFTRHKMSEWFRGRDAELADAKLPASIADAGSAGSSSAKAQQDSVPPAGKTPPIEDNETIVVPKLEEAEGALPPNASSDGADRKGTPAGEPGKAPTGGEMEGAKAEKEDGERKGESGEGGGDAAKPLSLSEEEVAKLKEEQEARCRELAMNVNVFMPYEGCVNKEQLLADEALAREAAQYLWDVALPFVTLEVKRGSLCPVDCAELAQVLHGAGVNVRYMGRLATVAVSEEAEDAAVRAEGKLRRWRMPLFWLEMLETEMAARAVTHVFGRYMAAGTARSRSAPGYAIQQFLNCLLGGGGAGAGAGAGADTKASTTSNGTSSSKSASPRGASSALSSTTADATIPAGSSWMPEDGEVVALTPAALWTSVTAEVAARFRHHLTIWGREQLGHGTDKSRVHKLALLRRVCQRLGVRVVSRSYELDKPHPFALEDIVSIFPVVKSCVPVSPAPDAAEALEMAQLHLTSGGGLQAAHDLAQHAATLLLQACDGMHSKYPAALNLQARVMYHVGDADTAVALQLKALAYLEQLEGLDSSSVVKCHEHLGQYYMLAGLYDKALAHMRAFCYLVELTAGPNHPDLADGYHRMGRAYQDVGSGMMALRCYQEALERQAGDHLINPRVHHSVAETLEAMRGFTDALKHERLSHAGYKAVHGDEHPMVIKSTQNIRALTTKIVQAAQDAKKLPAQLPVAKQANATPATTAETATPTGGSSKATAGNTAKSAPTAEPVDNGVEESKVNGPPQQGTASTGSGGGGKQGSAGGNGGGGKSKKKNRR